jgi:ABC-type transport system involved in multi-copper enzyme maturation permease subunit
MGGAITSEIRKIFTTRLWWGMALGMAGLAAAIAAGFAALVGTDLGGDPNNAQGNPFAAMNVGTAQLIYNAGLVQNFTTLFPLALGVLLITSEYRHKTITATFLSTPRRWVVMVSKAVAVAVIGAVYAVVHAVASIGGGALVLSAAKGVETLLTEPKVWQSLGIGVLAFIVWTLLGFGFGMLVRNQIAAVLIAVGVSFIAHIALNIIFSIQGWYDAAKWLPGNLTTGMLVTVDPTGGTGDPSANPYFSDWWVSALVLAGYAAVLAIAGAILTSRRDIT